MRVGIVGIIDKNNFGNRLQNYALQVCLSRYSGDVLTIRNKQFLDVPWKNIIRRSAVVDSPAILRLTGMHRSAAHARFTKDYINTSKGCCWFNVEGTAPEVRNHCHLYCAGSDQIWNPDFGRWGMFNYLGFANPEQTFSYAASFGVDKIPAQYVADVRKGLQHIKYISVREDAGKRIVEELTGRTDAQVLVDPTMLLTTQQWDEIARKPKAQMPRKYVLTYFLGDVPCQRTESIRRKADQMGAQVIELMDKNSPFYAIGPSEFVYLIKHACLVCTDSFHASVFSFLYQRPVAIFDRKGSADNMGSRLQTLAAKFGLQSSLAVGDAMPDLPVDVDYTAGFAALDEERKKSKAFLDMVFQEAERAGLCK